VSLPGAQAWGVLGVSPTLGSPCSMRAAAPNRLRVVRLFLVMPGPYPGTGMLEAR
jgi:hypothetical protein